MIQPNPEIEVIIDAATAKAKFYNHEYVTLEHVLHGIVVYEPFNKLLYNYGVDTDNMLKDIEIYLETIVKTTDRAIIETKIDITKTCPF